MCGIAGWLGSGASGETIAHSMIGRLEHRGPDDEGLWADPDAGVALAHRRLSIVDLSPLGHQPMASNDARYVLSYNGEIYNHMALRADLEAEGRARGWRGHSDTETLVECIAAWGLTRTLEKSVGMFALALWDRQDRTLRLARDRFGEKPLYYGWVGGDFLFASELKAMRAHPRFANPICRKALRLFTARTYVPAPLSIFKTIYKLEPGCILTASADVWHTPVARALEPGQAEPGLSVERYWSYRDTVKAGLADPVGSETEALELLETSLATAIGGQSVADVPVGAFLSGGIDSSTVVALYQKYSPAKIRTFSIGFEETGFDEAVYAKQVARHFGTEHNERYVSVKETQDVIPLLPWMYDEPFADSSQIPTYLVSKFAREQVTVALSGDGGDELFGGYNRYVEVARLWAQLKKLPAPLRAGLGRGLGQFPPGLWDRLSVALPGGKRLPHFGTKVQKALRTMGGAKGLDQLYDRFLDEWSGEGSPVLGGDGDDGTCAFDLDLGAGASDAARMMYGDARAYLPDDILCKVDRASMAVSLESRVPFLDHRVAAAAARIPQSMKIRGGTGKHILRQLLYREAPEAMFDRPKAGFAIPVGQWIRGPLRAWAEELLDEQRLRAEGYFDAAQVRRRWADHLAGRSDATQTLWAILMFQAWHQHWCRGARPADLAGAKAA